MMSTDKLTRKALEQHDKVHPKLLATKTKTRTSSISKDESPVVRRSRTESLSNGTDVTNNKSRPFERQTSRVSVIAKGPPNLSVFRVVQAARAWKRLSLRKPASVPEKPKVKLENTYRLGPETDQVFKPDKVKNVIKDVLTSFLRRFSYTPESSRQMSLCLANEIKARVKEMQFPRFKVVCQVIMMQNRGQGSEVSSRCIWNTDTDSFASYTHKTAQVICIASVHAVYFE